MNFTHLHTHSHYSILDGMASISGLVDKAISQSMPAIVSKNIFYLCTTLTGFRNLLELTP